MGDGVNMDEINDVELFKQVFNKVNDIITLIEIKEDGSAGNFIHVNDMTVEKLGYSREELAHMSPKDIGSSPIKNKVKINNLISEGKSTFKRVYRTKEGKNIPVEINSHMFDFEGKKVALSVARDITEREEAEKHIKESQERLKDLFDNASDLIQMINPDGTFLYVNKAWKDVLGYSDEDIENMNVFDVIFPDHVEQCKDIFERIMHGEKIDKVETGFKTKDNNEILVEGNVNSKMDLNGNVMYSRAIFRDVTERKQSEVEIKRLASIVESSGDAIVVYNLDGIILDWNPAAELIYGYSADEIKGKKVSTLMSTEKWEENLKNIEKIKKGGIVSHFETKRIRKDSTKIDVSLSFSPVKNIDGEIVGISTIARDITERKQSEKELEYAQLQLENAMDLAHLVYWELDMDSGIFTLNDRFYAMYGTTAEEEGGYDISLENFFDNFVHPDDSAYVKEGVQNILEGEPTFDSQVEHKIICRNGEIRDVVVNVKIIYDDQGNIVGVYGANQDITERKKAEDDLRASEEKYRKIVEKFIQNALSLISEINKE